MLINFVLNKNTLDAPRDNGTNDRTDKWRQGIDGDSPAEREVMEEID